MSSVKSETFSIENEVQTIASSRDQPVTTFLVSEFWQRGAVTSYKQSIPYASDDELSTE